MRTLTVCMILLACLAPAARAQDIRWPQELLADNGARVVIYQPQIEEFSGNSLAGRAAVSVEAPDADGGPVFGAIWLEARLDTDRTTRTAQIRDVRVADVRFADATDAQQEQLAGLIERELQDARMTISVDALLADLDASEVGVEEEQLRHEPPAMIHSSAPALLVLIDGEPSLQALEGTPYERVVNTPFLIVKDGAEHYLYVGSNAWFRAPAVSGPWARARSVPADIGALVEPADDDLGADDIEIIVATEPTELLVSDGEPSWAPVEGMDLLYMDNTDSHAFLELSTQAYYVLLSGRWYRGEGIVGDLQWTHVPNDELPEAFRDIPEDSVNGDVLSQVAGTPQAREAVLDNTIPQTAAIRRDDSSFAVEYDGAPEFAPVEQLPVEYALNTGASVFRHGKLYYACDNGVWYVADAATGPWAVATEIPEAIYDIPASNPHHNVTYVRVYEVTPEVVYVGYTPAYYGSYCYRGAVVYGTGWYYNPWYGRYYYPRCPTWGFHVSYNPWYGWSFGVSWTRGPFRFSVGRGGGWFGVGGYRPYARPLAVGGYRKTRIDINVDNSTNINIGGGGGGRLNSRPSLYDRPETRARLAERPGLPAERVARPASGLANDVLTDRSGGVFQRGADGGWQQRDNGRWRASGNLDRAVPLAPGSKPAVKPSAKPTMKPAVKPAARPASSPLQRPSSLPARSSSGGQAPRPQLERDFAARQKGAKRSQSFQKRGGRRR